MRVMLAGLGGAVVGRYADDPARGDVDVSAERAEDRLLELRMHLVGIKSMCSLPYVQAADRVMGEMSASWQAGLSPVERLDAICQVLEREGLLESAERHWARMEALSERWKTTRRRRGGAHE